MTELDRQRLDVELAQRAQAPARRVATPPVITVQDELPQRLWLVAQYFRVGGMLFGVAVVLGVTTMLIAPGKFPAALWQRPWMLLFAICSAVSMFTIGERLLRRERLAAIVALVLLLVPLIAAAAGRGTGRLTLALSAASAIALASVWRSLR